MARKDRSYTWVGGAQIIEPETDAGTTTSELLVLVPPQPVADIVGTRTQLLVEAIYLNFATHRILSTTVDALTFVVYMAPLGEASDLAAYVLNSQSLIDRTYSRKEIMMLGQLPVPPYVAAGDLLSTLISGEVMVAHHEYQASRKMDRAGQTVVMAVNCDVSVVTRVFCQWRVLLSY